MFFILTLWAAKFVTLVINLIDKNRGTSLPGRIAIKLMPSFTRHFKGLNPERIILVTGSNGKSTATNLLYQLIKNVYGNRVTANIEGANMLDGIATTLIKNTSLSGRVKSDWFVFEADERSLSNITQNLGYRALAVTNIQMDQAYRNADPDFILKKIEPCISEKLHLFLNADEPCSLFLGEKAGSVSYYGLPRHTRSTDHKSPYYQTRVCPRCGGKLCFDYYNASSMGPFSCTACGFKTPDKNVVRPDRIDFEKSEFSFEGASYRAAYNLPYHYYNYALALSVGKWLGLPDKDLKTAFSETFEAFQNYDENSGSFLYKNKELTYIRFKQENPDTLENALDRIAADNDTKALFIGLYPVQNALPYTADITYAYSVDFEQLKKANLSGIVIFSDPVAYDTKLRFLYAGFKEDELEILPTSDMDTILNRLDETDSQKVYFITNRHTYDMIYPRMKARMASKEAKQ